MIHKTRKFPFLLLLIFLILAIIGINMSEVSSVWEKAVRTCFSCIGIG